MCGVCVSVLREGGMVRCFAAVLLRCVVSSGWDEVRGGRRDGDVGEVQG